MSDDQIATALGQIMGKLDILHTQFRDYTESHDDRHTKIDTKLDDHAKDINQAKGAKAAVLLVASGLAALISWGGNKLF